VKYSNGFFVFHVQKSISRPNQLRSPFKVDALIGNGNLEGYECFSYIWNLSDSFGFRNEFHESTIWLNRQKEIAVIFVNNELLIDEIINGLEYKLELTFSPYSINFKGRFIEEENLAIPIEGISKTVNKVATNLLNNDIQRLKVIEEVL
jgi:hypothetical protein